MSWISVWTPLLPPELQPFWKFLRLSQTWQLFPPPEEWLMTVTSTSFIFTPTAQRVPSTLPPPWPGCPRNTGAAGRRRRWPGRRGSDAAACGWPRAARGRARQTPWGGKRGGKLSEGFTSLSPPFIFYSLCVILQENGFIFLLLKVLWIVCDSSLRFRLKYLNNCHMDWHEIWCRHSQFPEDKPSRLWRSPDISSSATSWLIILDLSKKNKNKKFWTDFSLNVIKTFMFPSGWTTQSSGPVLLYLTLV